MAQFGYLAAYAASAFLNAFVFWKLWGWFVVPLSAPAITYWHAFALGLFAVWFGIVGTIAPAETLQDKQGKAVVIMAKALVMLIILASGYMVHSLGGIA